MAISLPRGVRDYSPSESISLQSLLSIAEETFRQFGFSPLETPGIERLEVLNGKAYGEDANKELYLLDGKEEGLRYDFTVPLARFVAMNRDIPLPFKRYQIGKVWRMDEPQKMRSREFIQADVDIVGSPEAISDAEVIAPIALALEAAGIREYSIFINSRVILDSLLKLFEVPEEGHTKAIRALDKLSKIGRREVSELIARAGASTGKAEELLNFVVQEGSNDDKLLKLLNVLPSAKSETERISNLLLLLSRYGIKGKMELDFSLARGLDYYTGGIWEFVPFENGRRLPSIASGGRYDNLLELYSKTSIPAVGTSIGISRVFEILERKSATKTYARVHIAYIKDENLAYAMQVANAMRTSGIYTDLGLTKRALTKQLEYTNSMNIKYVAILGNQEREAKKVKLRNMESGEEETVGLDEAIAKLKAGS